MIQIAPFTDNPKFRFESGNWMTLVQELPNLADNSAMDLLLMTQRELAVPLRYAMVGEDVVLIGEYPLPNHDQQFLAKETLQRWVRGAFTSDVALDDEEIETLLNDLAETWSRRGDNWIVSAPLDGAVELTVRRTARGLRVEGVLADLNSVSADRRNALALFLCRAQNSLRFVRFELGADVRAVAEAESGSLNEFLGHCLGSVAEACRVFAAEVRALATTDLGIVYLETPALSQK